MDIPLKSQPKVSTVNLLDDSKFGLSLLDNAATNDTLTQNNVNYSTTIEPRNIPNLSKQKDESNYPTQKNYKLTRTYSETEANNFDLETGHRLYDDGRIRPKLSVTHSNSSANLQDNSNNVSPPKIYSRSHNEFVQDDLQFVVGLEDEYIPGLNFSDMVYRWNKVPSEQNLHKLQRFDYKDENTMESTSTSFTNTPGSKNASYLDLNDLHAKVAPQPIQLKNHLQQNFANRYSLSKLNDFVKLRNPASIPDDNINEKNKSSSTIYDSLNKYKKQKSSQIIDPITGGINYEAILSSLPLHFNELPYSQRKKLVQSYSESIDYSQFSLFAKNYFSDKVSLSQGRTPKSGISSSNNSHFTRKSRVSSSNTVAGKLLAISASSSDIQKFKELKPKVNVDEKGAIVMNHVLGKIIGFGAWGTIRECFNENETVRAIKIVKSYREPETRSPNNSYGPSSHSKNHLHHSHNPKVLQVFKKEIEIWKQLHHDNILPLLQYYQTDDAIFCITDRIFGGTLFEVVTNWGLYNSGALNSQGSTEFLIDKQKSRLMETVYFVRQIIEALLYLHEELGIVHGDLKLENILVDDLDKDHIKMILCDFGMSRVYTTRLGRKTSRGSIGESGNGASSFSENTIRSKSSTADLRRPYKGDEFCSYTRQLFKDDSKIGISNYMKPHGPSLQSIDLTPTQSNDSLLLYHEIKSKDKQLISEGIESNLPHSHIGSLPYASPELLLPSPPPLGPSADIWALGVLMYTMVVGKLPFQHPYEPRLRAVISAGKFNRSDARKACLVEWIFAEKEADNVTDTNNEGGKTKNFASSIMDSTRREQLINSRKSWERYNENEFQWLYEMIIGCLTADITKRWDLDMIHASLIKHIM